MSEFDPSKPLAAPASAASRPSAADLMQKVREAGISAATALIRRALDAADDSLFGFSEKTDSATERGQFMDAMRSIRVKRSAMEQTFREQLTTRFMEFVRNRGQQSAATAPVFESDTLSLVDEHDLEEDLAVTGMSSKATTRHNSPLFALNARLAAILGIKELNTDANPLGPPAVCQSLRAVIRQVDADITVKLVVLKLLDRHVVTDLDDVYEVTNRLLADAGVLPHIKYTRPARAPGSPAPPRAEGEAGDEAQAGATHSGDGGGGSAGANEVIAALANLLAERRRSVYGERRSTGPNISNTDLMAALSRLQAEDAAGDPDDLALSPAQRVERVKQDLLEQLRRGGIDQPDGRVATADEDAIDLVGMLFQFVVQDRNLPAEVQASLSRLQIPYVRVALKDKHLFAQKVHPARRLLDTLAVASVTWTREGDRDGKFLAQLNTTVDRVVAEYSDDLELFNTLNGEFELFLTQQRKSSEAAEQRTTEAVQGKEKLAQARRTTTRVVNARIGKRELPPLARELISKPWSQFMVLTHLRQGGESPEWKSAVNFIDAVIWACLPKAQEQDIQRLHALLPQMQTTLRRGLQVVGFGENEAEYMVQGLGALLSSMHQREVPMEATSVVQAAEKSLATSGPQHAPLPEPEAPEPATPDNTLPDDDQYLVRVRAMKVGTWIEFVQGTGARERAKLSWISPFSARFLFVNRKGLKVAERSVYDLANELREGTAQILEVAPIFERALDSIMTHLKQEHAQAGAKVLPSGQKQA